MRAAASMASLVAMALVLASGGGAAIPLMFAFFAATAATVRQITHVRRGRRCPDKARGHGRRFYSRSP